MRITFFRLFIIVALVAELACYRNSNQDVVVHIYRNPDGAAARWLLHEMGDFQKAGLSHTTDGKRIVLATIEPTNYGFMLNDIGSKIKPDLVILDSASDATALLTEEMRHAGPRGLGTTGCLAFVPSWSSGEEREAAEIFLSFLTRQRWRVSGTTPND